MVKKTQNLGFSMRLHDLEICINRLQIGYENNPTKNTSGHKNYEAYLTADHGYYSSRQNRGSFQIAGICQTSSYIEYLLSS